MCASGGWGWRRMGLVSSSGAVDDVPGDTRPLRVLWKFTDRDRGCPELGHDPGVDWPAICFGRSDDRGGVSPGSLVSEKAPFWADHGWCVLGKSGPLASSRSSIDPTRSRRRGCRFVLHRPDLQCRSYERSTCPDPGWFTRTSQQRRSSPGIQFTGSWTGVDGCAHPNGWSKVVPSATRTNTAAALRIAHLTPTVWMSTPVNASPRARKLNARRRTTLLTRPCKPSGIRASRALI